MIKSMCLNQGLEVTLKEGLKVSVGGKDSSKNYRAVMRYTAHDTPGKLVVVVQEYFPSLDEWRNTPGQWYLSTLLEGGKIRDSISIDAGQRWQVDSGLSEALTNAIQYL